MAQIRTTKYVCDRCDTEVARKRDLTRYKVLRQNEWDTLVDFDLCPECIPIFAGEVAKTSGKDVEGLFPKGISAPA